MFIYWNIFIDIYCQFLILNIIKIDARKKSKKKLYISLNRNN